MGMILAAVVLFALVVLVAKAVRMVPQGYEWTVEAFGKYTHTLSPGLHFLMPIYQGIGRKVNMMEQVLEVPSQDVITKDNAVVKVDGVVFFQVLDAAKAAYEGLPHQVRALGRDSQARCHPLARYADRQGGPRLRRGPGVHRHRQHRRGTLAPE